MAQMNPPPAVDAQTVSEATNMWRYFTKGATLAVGISAVILLILYFTLV
jgi:hypothetical protein